MGEPSRASGLLRSRAAYSAGGWGHWLAVSVDAAQRRVAWAVEGQQFRHYNGAAWVEPDPKGGSRFIRTVDLLPNEMASQVEQMMTTGIAVVRQTLETAKAA